MRRYAIVTTALIIIALSVAMLFIKGITTNTVFGGEKITYADNRTVVESNDTGMVMYPTLNQTIRELTTIKLFKAPPNTVSVWFGLMPKSRYTDKSKANLGFDPDGSNGWSLDFSIKSIESGKYVIFIIPEDSNKKELDRIFTDVKV